MDVVGFPEIQLVRHESMGDHLLQDKEISLTISLSGTSSNNAEPARLDRKEAEREVDSKDPDWLEFRIL